MRKRTRQDATKGRLAAGALMAALLAAPAPADASLKGVEVIEGPMLHFDESIGQVSDTKHPPRQDAAVRLLLSRGRYPAEDMHVDAVVWLDSDDAAPEGELSVALLDEQESTLASDTLSPIPGDRVFFSFEFPDRLAGEDAYLRVTWDNGETSSASVQEAFTVEPAAELERSGRVSLEVPNDTGAKARAVPVTVGVPFPRGVVSEPENLRLVDETGAEVALQTKVTARWSRFGSIRWVQCDFTVDLDGEPRRYFLEYGPDVTRTSRDPINVESGEGFPVVDAGRLRVDEGIHVDIAGDGEFTRLVEADALHGAYIEHEDGREYVMPADVDYEVEEQGSEKVVVRRRGWYVEPATDRRFCRFDTRFVIHRDSPVVRMFHTWIFTGDSDYDRIMSMGWRFPLAEMEPGGFLRSFDSPDAWLDADALVQYDHSAYRLLHGGQADRDDEREDGRAAGVFAAKNAEAQLHFGVNDFWQNFPSELEYREGTLIFHNWPRYGRPRWNTPATVDDAILNRYAHEGHVLDFALPDEYAEDPIYRQTYRGVENERHWRKNRPDIVNAQGVARTEEMWLYFADADTPAEQATRLMQGLDERSTEAVVDPEWVAATGALGVIRHRDLENYPEHERIYELIATAPMRWTDHIGLYGMWLHGESLWGPRLDERSATLYRGLRKGHHNWPYSWIPYARSGDLQMRRFAEAATRQMIDANFCHYVSDEVAEKIAGMPGSYYRTEGFWRRSAVPWVSRGGPRTRSYAEQSDYLWHAYYLTGFRRAADMAERWGELTRRGEKEGMLRPGRAGVTMQRSYLHMYEATFDPWFLVATHELAKMHRTAHRDRAAHRDDHWLGHPWTPADRDFHRYTGSEAHREYYLAYAHAHARRQGRAWTDLFHPIEPSAYTWRLTGDEHFLRRLVGILDRVRVTTYDDEIEHYLGYALTDRSTQRTHTPLVTSWYLTQFPVALAALAEAGADLDPIYSTFIQQSADYDHVSDGECRYQSPPIYMSKAEGEPLELSLHIPRGEEADGHTYRIEGPDGRLVEEGALTALGRAAAVQSLRVAGDEPAGVYRVQWTGDDARPGWQHHSRWGSTRGLAVPVSAPDTPEVMALNEEHRMGWAIWDSEYWIKVPEGIGSFTIAFDVADSHNEMRRLTVWNPDGERAWDHLYFTPDGEYDGPNPIEATIEVDPEHAGELWRLTLPGRNAGFQLDDRLPPYVATAPGRWFNPEAR